MKVSSSELKRIMRFIISGGSAALAEFISFFILVTYIQTPVSWSAAISFCIGLVISFVLNHKFVFGDKKNETKPQHAERIILFISLALVNLLISSLAVTLLSRVIPALIAKLLVMAAVALWNYFIFKIIIFNPNRESVVTYLQKAFRIEALYALIAIPFGLIFIFAIPPGWNNDEPQHYWRVQQIVGGEILPKDLTTGNTRQLVGGDIDTNAASFILSFGGYTGIDDPSFRAHFPSWNDPNGYTQTKTAGEKKSIEFPGSALYSPVVYLPQLAGQIIGNALHLSLLHSFYLGKLFGLLLTVAAFVIAIRIIPRGKWILLIVGLLPSMVVQSTAYGGDVMTNAFSIITIAYILWLSFRQTKLSASHYVILCSLLSILGLIKPTYLVIGMLLIAVPLLNQSMRKKTELFKLLIPFILSIILALAWTASVSFIHYNGNPNADISGQEALIIHNPIRYLGVLANTYFTDVQPNIYRSLFGNFTWDRAPLPLVFNFMLLICLILGCFVRANGESIRKYTSRQENLLKLIMLSVAFITILLISTALYIYFSTKGSSYILGIQGRYFIPILPLLLIPFAGGHLRHQKIAKINIVVIIIMSLIAGLITVYGRIY